MRKPAVAGSFYAGSPASLQRQIEDCFKHPLGPGALPGDTRSAERHTLGLVSPHAGYRYSGPVAANGFALLAGEKMPETVVIVGPNHRGLGAEVAVGRQGSWQTPLGSVDVDPEVGEAVIAGGQWARWDDLAHGLEHSLEVQVPFLQYIYGSGFKIVPIAMLRQDLEIARDLGRAIASALKGRAGLIIASTDFSHYEAQASAVRKDRLAIDAILRLDPALVEATVIGQNISMCGPGPVMAMIAAARELGARTASLLRYNTSGDITGDYSEVVGYASVAITG